MSANGSDAATLVDWVGGLRHEHLPESVRERVGTALLHHILCGANAQRLPAARAAAALADGSQQTAGAQALVDAVFGHATLQEDMHVASQCHIGTVVLPAALAMAGERESSGAQFVTAVAAGYEAMGRIGQVLAGAGLSERARPTGTCGPLGSWAASSSLARLDSPTSSAALGLAANGAAGLNGWAWQGGEEVFLHAGLAAQAGILGTRLADAGMRGSMDVLFGRSGYLETHGDSRSRAEVSVISWPGAEGRWVLDEVVFKPHPGCNYVQTVIDVCNEMQRSGVLRGRTPQRVEVAVSTAAVAYPGCDWRGPWRNRLEAQMSIQFAAAAVLSGADYAEALDDIPDVWTERYQMLAGRVDVITAPDIDTRYPSKQGARVTVIMAGGETRTLEHKDMISLTAADIRTRLRVNAEALRCPELAESLISMADDLPGQASMRPLSIAVHELWALSAKKGTD